MSSRCDPWPENTNAVLPLTAVLRTTAASGSSDARAASARITSAGLSATTTARCSNAARVVASEKPRSGKGAELPVRRRACSRNAVPVRADNTTGTTPGVISAGACAPGSGACSRMTCALVPLIPNDDTAARRGRSTAGHGVSSRSSSTAPADQSTWDDGVPTCRVRGAMPCRNANTDLITPATPAAPSVWPRFDFTDPSSSGCARSWP
jgi:hypothetical protein